MENLLKYANEAMAFAYCPYSSFFVGAALLCKDGKIFTGANIENSSYSATICAERVAFSKAISSGEKDFVAIAIVGGKNKIINSYCEPCGMCRQFMREFCSNDFKILLQDGENNIKSFSLCELLPNSFGANNIK